MKSIKEKSNEYVDSYYKKLGISKDEYPTDVMISRVDFIAGANYALDAIEEFMDNMYFGSNEAGMFYKDFKANIHKFIEQLKGNK